MNQSSTADFVQSAPYSAILSYRAIRAARVSEKHISDLKAELSLLERKEFAQLSRKECNRISYLRWSLRMIAEDRARLTPEGRRELALSDLNDALADFYAARKALWKGR